MQKVHILAKYYREARQVWHRLRETTEVESGSAGAGAGAGEMAWLLKCLSREPEDPPPPPYL